MSETHILSDLIKSLPSATDAGKMNLILSDNDGELKKIQKSGLLMMDLVISNQGGANILNDREAAIVLAIDNETSDNYCLYFAQKPDSQSRVKCTVIRNKGIGIQATNAIGTVALNRTTNATQYVLKFVSVS